MPIESNLHLSPFWSAIVVFGLNLALPLLCAGGLVVAGMRREGEDRRVHFDLARLAIIACVVLQLFSVSYQARLFFGTTEVGMVTNIEPIPAARNPQCELTIETAHGTIEHDVRLGDCSNLATGASVPVITILGSTMFAQAGERATANVGLLLLPIVPLFLLTLLWLAIRTPPHQQRASAAREPLGSLEALDHTLEETPSRGWGGGCRPEDPDTQREVQ